MVRVVPVMVAGAPVMEAVVLTLTLPFLRVMAD
jgi:hypothetical protein